MCEQGHDLYRRLPETCLPLFIQFLVASGIQGLPRESRMLSSINPYSVSRKLKATSIGIRTGSVRGPRTHFIFAGTAIAHEAEHVSLTLADTMRCLPWVAVKIYTESATRIPVA